MILLILVCWLIRFSNSFPNNLEKGSWKSLNTEKKKKNENTFLKVMEIKFMLWKQRNFVWECKASYDKISRSDMHEICNFHRFYSVYSV